MSDPKSKEPTPGPFAPARNMEPIAVVALWMAQERDVPLRASQGGMRQIRAGQHRQSGMKIEIWYEPWQRMYRVRETDEARREVTEFCMPESWALYIVTEPRRPAA